MGLSATRRACSLPRHPSEFGLHGGSSGSGSASILRFSCYCVYFAAPRLRFVPRRCLEALIASGMVRIAANGDIVQDNEPRQPPVAARSAASARQAPSPGPSSSNAFDLSAAPIAMAEPRADDMLGLPDFLVFQARIKPVHLIAVAAATWYLGWKGALAGLGVLYISSRGQVQSRDQPAPAHTQMGSNFATASAQASKAQAGTPAARQLAAEAASKRFCGQAHKLSS